MYGPPVRRCTVTEAMASNAARATARQKQASSDDAFAAGDHVVYPTHGVGQVVEVGREEIAGHSVELIRIIFARDRMTLRVPAASARNAGLRRIISADRVDEVLAILRGRPRRSKLPWVRRVQTLQIDLASGDPLLLARVLCDLRRNASADDTSTSERVVYEKALLQLAGELCLAMKVEEAEATAFLVSVMRAANDTTAPDGE